MTIALQACGASDSVSSKSPAAILAASRAAAREASAVHVLSQTYVAIGDPKTKAKPALTIELQLSGGDGRARLVLGRREHEVTRIGNALYIKGGPEFDRQLARVNGQHLAPGTWVRAPANSSQFAGSVALTEPAGELSLLLRSPTLSVTKGPITTIDGQKAIELKTKGKLYTGAIYVATTGKPYSLMIVKHGRENSTTTFSGWNDPETVQPPANAIDISRFQQSTGH